jgi:hypothetical protein
VRLESVLGIGQRHQGNRHGLVPVQVIEGLTAATARGGTGTPGRNTAPISVVTRDNSSVH